MSKENRKSVSVKAATLDRLEAYCERTGKKASTIVDMLVNQYIDNNQKPTPAPVLEVDPEAN